MKQLLVIAFMLLVVTSCNKQVEQQSEPKQMSYEQLSKEIGKENAFTVFDHAGLTESATVGDPLARGSKKVKEGAAVAVWFNDILLDVSAYPSITYTTSPNAEWGGVTVFVSQTSNDGALGIWDCGRWFNAGTPPSVTCTSPYLGQHRAFTSDHAPDYSVHISEFKTVN